MINTGVFDDNRYFNVFVEYAKESPEDILIQFTIHNRGPEAAELHLLPTLWFRNQWSWQFQAERPSLVQTDGAAGHRVVEASHPILGKRYLYCEGRAKLLFTENETNTQRIFGVANRTPYVKDSINEYIIHAQTAAVNPAMTGTKAAAHCRFTVATGRSQVVRLRLSDVSPPRLPKAMAEARWAAISTISCRPAAARPTSFIAA